MGAEPISNRGRPLLATGVAILAMTLSSGCGNDDTDDPLDRGAAVYQQSCAACHGADLRGTPQGPSHLSQVYAPDHHSDAAFRAAILHGSPAHHWDYGDMPPIPGLSDGDIDAVIAYIRHEQETQGFEPYPPG